MTVDWEGLEKIVDDVDTEFAVRESLSTRNLDDLQNAIDQIYPYLQGYGPQEDVNRAVKMYYHIRRMMGRNPGESSEGAGSSTSNVDTSLCQLCGEKMSGTPEELDEMEAKHLQTVHPEYLPKNA